ncbi:Rhodopsin-like GPCR transmembrane domain [Popillia japonica]|uniref:Rhodopsin-like GPCR transmembrane domain n=1 Tax=Popillia japonica TaxID=7064 RepID=A0AAW1KKL6_POPJA
MTNGLPGDYWHEHFSADEFYILPVLTAFSVAYSFLILGIVVCSIELKSRQLLHTTYKLYVVSVFIQFFGIILHSMAYLKYAVNGVGAPSLKMIGAMSMGCSETCFLLLLLLLAKGYTITRGKLSLTGSVKLTIFMCLYSITYIALFIYEAKVFDPGEVLYLYESPAGYGLIVLRIFAWCIFIYSTYPEKSNFYYPFNIFGTLWFIAGPAFILSANTYIDKWIRESVVCAVLLFITFGGHLMFLLLTMPSVANKNFPYHVRTTQIGVMEVAGTSGSSTIEQFSHHVYEPTRTAEQTVIIPLTKRTEELFGGIYTQRLYNSSFRNSNQPVPNAPVPTELDIAMENVLTWSLAKNVSALEFGHNLGNLEHTAGLDSPDFRRRNSASTARESATQSPQRNCDEWVREVPVELFTVSRLVVNKDASVNKSED